jgi:GNAT superfamily N-acetyltransferase
MDISYANINSGDYDIFHRLMTEYYREAEDKDTPQEDIDAFVRLLFDMILSGKISGCFAVVNQCTAGFVLWMKDTAQSEFSTMPGYGTILEIGLDKEFRNRGIGKALVGFAEQQMNAGGVDGLYVCAYGPAQGFWLKCGYRDSKGIAKNGLPVLIKDII